jgi:hypothetical protein
MAHFIQARALVMRASLREDVRYGGKSRRNLGVIWPDDPKVCELPDRLCVTV